MYLFQTRQNSDSCPAEDEMTQLKCHLCCKAFQLPKGKQVPFLFAPTALVIPLYGTPTLYFMCVYVCLLHQTGSPMETCEPA